MPPKVAIIFIGTSKYADFFPEWKRCVDKHFLKECDKTIIAITDRVDEEYFHLEDVYCGKVAHMEWPFITVLRFRFINEIPGLKQFDYVFFLDADLFPSNDILLSEIISPDKKLVGVQHPGNFLDSTWNTLDRTPGSTACVSGDITSYGTTFYHQGCLWGGTGKAVSEMVLKLAKNVDADLKNNIMAIWHDESHMNKYFLENIADVHTLHSGFAYPEHGNWAVIEDNLEIKMVHKEKSHEDFPRFRGNNPHDKG
ncbi:hypothetical protein CMI47_02415 [Candidatus Pacearchaeota archaeon]|nr:hypothetical protein [Candidatus Pacearchaeota archaeon]